MKCHRVPHSAPVMAVLAVATLLLSACSSTYKAEASGEPAATSGASSAKAVAPAPAPAVPEASLPKLLSAGDIALADGLKAYQAGRYRQAETHLKAALKAGLDVPGDLAAAHKHLAFIYCTSKRITLCGAAFKNAKAADASFALTKAEAGHPMWAKTYKKALGLK